MSSVVERSSSARLLPEGRKTSPEISPCATLSRDDKIKKKKGTKNYGK